MCNYSSAKLELLVLKWAIIEKVWHYLLGLQFQVYMDNNLLAHVQESKLGALQIQCFSKLALFNFTIKYWTAHSNRATYALSYHPFNPSCNFESKTDSDGVEVISYSSVCKVIDQCLNSSKIPEDLKHKVQDISCVVQSIVEKEDKGKIAHWMLSPFLKKLHLKK